MLAPVIRKKRKSIWNMLVEKQELKTSKLRWKFERKPHLAKSKTPPVGIFSTTINHRDLKLGTHMQVHNTDTPAKFQGHSPIITPITPHMCSIQGH